MDLTPTHNIIPSRDALIEDPTFAPAERVGDKTITPNRLVDSGASYPLIYASTISVDPSLSSLFTTTTVAATGNATINSAAVGKRGQVIYFIITNDASGARTITFGSNFSPSATIVGTINKKAVIAFISDGTKFYELSRTTGLT